MKLITLDWEGTLVDFQWNLDAAVAETTTMLEAGGIPGDTFTNLDYAAIYNLVEEKGTTCCCNDFPLTSLIDRIYDKYDLDAASRWVLDGNLTAMLNRLKGFKLALVTNIGRKGIDSMLHKYNLRKYFGLILTRDDLRFLKPAPEGIEKAMFWAGAGKNETIHIGDSLSDVFAARNAGVRFGVVLGGQNTAEKLLQENPDLVLQKLEQLPEKLEQLRLTFNE